MTPVTNAQFAEFLEATGYRPRHRGELPQALVGAASRRPGQEDHPVVYVDLDDARAYAGWAGKRLPTEEEWQYAAQGTDGREYPWGNEHAPGPRATGGETGGTTPVKALPGGPFAVRLLRHLRQRLGMDRERAQRRPDPLLHPRGGSYYTAKGSDWYMDGGPRPCTVRRQVPPHVAGPGPLRDDRFPLRRGSGVTERMEWKPWKRHAPLIS